MGAIPFGDVAEWIYAADCKSVSRGNPHTGSIPVIASCFTYSRSGRNIDEEGQEEQEGFNGWRER